MPGGVIYEAPSFLYPGVCFECGAPAKHRHHVVPATRGGTRVVWLCESCHEKTHGYHDGAFAMMHAARRDLIKRGGYGGGHRIRRKYGVEIVEVRGKLMYHEVPTEQAVIRRIKNLRASGWSLGTIAKTLNNEGVATATGATWSRKVVRDLVLRN